MIQEILVTSVGACGTAHIAPMGVHVVENRFHILPFKPAATLDNILATRSAVINCCDDVRIFAGCLTGRRDWPLQPAEYVKGYYLTNTLAHTELELEAVEDDPVRPRLICRPVYTVNHRPFKGFNRAQFAVLEAAILISRLNLLPWDKVMSELAYLKIGLEKCAGDKERQAWEWLMEAIEQHRQNTVAL